MTGDAERSWMPQNICRQSVERGGYVPRSGPVSKLKKGGGQEVEAVSKLPFDSVGAGFSRCPDCPDCMG